MVTVNCPVVGCHVDTIDRNVASVIQLATALIKLFTCFKCISNPFYIITQVLRPCYQGDHDAIENVTLLEKISDKNLEAVKDTN